MIDEYPMLAVVAAFAEGETRMEGLSELKLKESDRLARHAAGLAACGVDARIEGDDLIVQGQGEVKGGGLSRHIWITASPWPFSCSGLAHCARHRRRHAHDRHELSRLRQLMTKLGATSHDHRHRRAGGLRQGHARQARRRALRLAYLDTGRLYRAVARDTLAAGDDPSDAGAALKAAQALDPQSLDDATCARPSSAKRLRSWRGTRRCARRCSPISGLSRAESPAR